MDVDRRESKRDKGREELKIKGQAAAEKARSNESQEVRH